MVNEILLKRELAEHFKIIGLGNNKDGAHSKDDYRQAHSIKRSDNLKKHEKFLESNWQKLIPFIANGSDVNPEKIKVRLEVVDTKNISNDIFRLATLNWSIPVSEGYGRRIRFIVWDESNNKIIGIFALGDAVFNLKVRDDLIQWNSEQRKRTMVNVMDAFILGAIPPYSNLLGGKLLASLIKSQEVAGLFREKYKSSKGIISNDYKDPYLSLVTVTSALGRSSIYNRLNLGGDKIFEKIGNTSGYGHFQFSDDLFQQMVLFLNQNNYETLGLSDFGSGPNWKFRIIRKALKKLNLNYNLINHGFTREVYVSKIAANAFDMLNGNCKEPDYKNLREIEEIVDLAKTRWVLPRAKRDNSFQFYTRDLFMKNIKNG